ncbi:diaminobutyrate acetyltransferase [Neptuniibacter halophilus]|uniref:diaminobutyrate acetyltransferase n=1 Tax=Neptuniibacter halophilus TaxID=651666 RepID=UPI002572581E|nr:diaminobutyrate acetyltransferase [Neptuniibacter halophilus]
MSALIRRCPPLDTNSLYCNLLQCRDFSETSILAEGPDGQAVGFISGYIPPARPDTLFIWQVALDSNWRGQGIARTMLSELFQRVEQAKYLETTISPSNAASRKLFTGFFSEHFMEYETSLLFERGDHLDADHEDEVLYRAGPAISFKPMMAS